jgi:hypothetical protein
VIPSGKSKLRRVNPKSAAGVKITGREPKGGNRQEGNQTLKAERSGQVKLVISGPAVPDVLKGAKAHERR